MLTAPPPFYYKRGPNLCSRPQDQSPKHKIKVKPDKILCFSCIKTTLHLHNTKRPHTFTIKLYTHCVQRQEALQNGVDDGVFSYIYMYLPIIADAICVFVNKRRFVGLVTMH